MLSTTSKPSSVPVTILEQDNLQIPNFGDNIHPKKLNKFILDKLSTFCSVEETLLQLSNATYGDVEFKKNYDIDNDTQYIEIDKEIPIIIPRFKLTYLTDIVIKDKDKYQSKLGLVLTCNYENNRSIINLALSEIVLICKNGLISEKCLLENRSSISNKFGIIKMLHMFLNKETFEEAISHYNTLFNILNVYLPVEREKEILGDLLQKSHTKNHVTDISVISLAARYSQNHTNPFKRNDNYRTYYDFYQDFTYSLKENSISEYIKKTIDITKYFTSIVLN